MRHLLVVSYHFPPAGGVPVRRILRFIRHLPGFGWRCSVLTADRPYDPFHPEDREGLDRLPELSRILRPPARSAPERVAALGYGALASLRGRLPGARDRAASLDDIAAGGFRRWINHTLFFPDPKRWWIPGAVAAGRRLFEEDPFDAILATGYPWSSFVVAHRLGHAVGRPVILDYRDAWSDNPRRQWTGRRHEALEGRLLRASRLVIAATHGIRRDLLERSPSTRVETLETGFDPAEYPARDPEIACPGRVLVVYTGTFNDPLPPSSLDRSPYHLLRALARLPAAARERIRLRLVGRIPGSYRRFVQQLGLEGVVECLPPVSHARALQHQLAADVVLLVLGRDPEGSAGILTGKLLEYIGAGRPIWALAPESEASRLIRREALGWVDPPDDEEAIAGRLRELARGGVRPVPQRAERFAAAPRARQLAAWLDEIAGAPTARESAPILSPAPSVETDSERPRPEDGVQAAPGA